MSVVRSPVRSVVRSPVRSVLGSGALSSSNLQQILALSPSLLIWPAKGSGWQGTSGGTLSATGQPVGLLPDLAALGGKTQAAWLASAPELVTNGGFDADASWSKEAGWTISGGVLNASVPSGFTDVRSTGTAIGQAGKVYRLKFDMVVSAGGVRPFVAGVSHPSTISTTGTHEILFFGTAASYVAFVAYGGGGTFTGSIDNVSVKALPGNHLCAGTWATPVDASRPLLTAGGAVDFDGSNDYFSLLNAISITESMTVVRAFKRSAAGIRSLGLAGNGGGGVPYAMEWSTDNIIRARMPSGSATSADTATGSFAASYRRTASASSLRLNGVEVLTGNPGAASDTLTVLGVRAATTAFISGEISFVAVFPTELTGADLALVERIAAGTNGTVLS